MPIAATSENEMPHLFISWRAVATWLRYISLASCSTQPGFGKYCVVSDLLDANNVELLVEQYGTRTSSTLVKR